MLWACKFDYEFGQQGAGFCRSVAARTITSTGSGSPGIPMTSQLEGTTGYGVGLLTRSKVDVCPPTPVTDAEINPILLRYWRVSSSGRIRGALDV